MVSTTKLLPSPFLQPYIKWFGLREFEAPESAPLVRPLPAMSEFMIGFNLSGGKTAHQGHAADKTNPTIVRKLKSISYVVGLFDEFMGTLSYSGKHRGFTIEFTPNGFYNIFGWSASKFTSETFAGDDVFGTSMALLEEELCESTTLQEMARISEVFLKLHLQRRKIKSDAEPIRALSHFLENATVTSFRIDHLANMACMSVKSFERKFREQVGVTPKYFSRIIRFNKALRQKLIHPHESWTSVAHATGYFDQMHFIRDFKQFAGMSPNAFLQHLPPPTEVLNNGA